MLSAAYWKDENAVAFTTNFDDLGDADVNDPNFCGFDRIQGLASQRLMAEGYGFGAEGDWKTACLYRHTRVMNQGLEKGCSFLEDYTLNFAEDRTSSLQSHMLEVCPLIATDKPKLEVHFLGIGIRKQQTARLVFTSKTGKGVKATVVDLGNRFRLIASEVECIEPKAMPKLPVASALGFHSQPSRLVQVLGFSLVVLTTVHSLTILLLSTGKISARFGY